MRFLLLLACFLAVGCSNKTEIKFTGTPIFSLGATDTPRPALALGQPSQIADGLLMAPVSLQGSKCDSGQGLVVEADFTNKTSSFIHEEPSVSVVSPDNQKLTQYAGIRGKADGPAYDGFLPQGFPPNTTTKGYICIPTGGQPFVGKYVGTLPATFTGWKIINGQSTWLVR